MLLPVAALSAATVGVAVVRGKVAGWAAAGGALAVAMAVVTSLAVLATSTLLLRVQLRLGQPKIA